MSRIVLVLWNEEDARQRASGLRKAGHRVDVHSEQGSAGLRAVRDAPPEAFVIDLDRLPSHGGAAATWFRQQKATRRVPIVFVGGEPDKVSRIRRQLPDATYTDWRCIRGALREALRRKPDAPIVPGTMDGYSGTPLPKKLGIKANDVVALLGAPQGFSRSLEPLPENVRLRSGARGRADVWLLFARSLAELKRRFPGALRGLPERGRLWIAWPKQLSGVATDLGQQSVREYGMAAGLVDYKICSIDATWSGLCFAHRRSRER